MVCNYTSDSLKSAPMLIIPNILIENYISRLTNVVKKAGKLAFILYTNYTTHARVINYRRANNLCRVLTFSLLSVVQRDLYCARPCSMTYTSPPLVLGEYPGHLVNWPTPANESHHISFSMAL